MVDYMNGIDIPIYSSVIYKSYWYSLTPSISNGNLFISFSIDKNMIDLGKIKSSSLLLKPSIVLWSLAQFNFALFQSISNLDEKYNDWMQHNIIVLACTPTVLCRDEGTRHNILSCTTVLTSPKDVR